MPDGVMIMDNGEGLFNVEGEELECQGSICPLVDLAVKKLLARGGWQGGKQGWWEGGSPS